MIRYLKGDATAPQAKGPKIIAHICNTLGGWGRGFVLAISKRWSEPERYYRAWHHAGTIPTTLREGSLVLSSGDFGLGQVLLVQVLPDTFVLNMIAQQGLKSGSKGPPIRYNALAACLRTGDQLARDMIVPDSGCESPSAQKPAAVVESWKLEFPIEIIPPVPAELEEFCFAHDPDFVKDVLACRHPNGFGNTSRAVAAALPWTTGAMLSAARHALSVSSGGVAAAPCSGFHHAGFASAGGFCTFNGLMVTALALRKYGRVRRVGILDLDMHYGNGTDDIIHACGHDNEDWIKHFTAGEMYLRPSQAPEFFSETLPHMLDWMADCDLVLYQAGADPHIDDPFGGWLTTEELRRRDAMVFEALSKSGVPVAWNLAGGYQRDADGGISKVLAIHDNTMRECVRVFGEKNAAA